MRRKSLGVQRPYRAYNFRTEVEPARLQAIGAISLAWNWIEGAIDASLSVALNLHPSLWLEVTTRINGFDGKIALLKKYSLLYLDDISKDAVLGISKALNAIEDVKRYRDGVIHVRLTDPTEIAGDIPVRRGDLHEILVSQEALDSLYGKMILICREVDEVAIIIHNHWLAMYAQKEPTKLQAVKDFRLPYFFALGLFYHQYTKLEHHLTCVIQVVARSLTIPPFDEVLPNALVGGMRMSPLKDTIKRLMRVLGVSEEKRGLADALFLQLGEIQFLRDRLAHHLTYPIVEAGETRWVNIDSAAVRESSKSVWIEVNEEVLNAATTDMSAIATLSDGLFSEIDRAPREAASATLTTWLYKPSMLTQHRQQTDERQKLLERLQIAWGE